MTVWSFVGGSLVLLIGLFFLIIALSSLLSVIGGAQFVATSSGIYETIRDFARLAPGERFVELGSGMGQLCRYIVRATGAQATGIDINPVLVLYSRWLARKEPNVHYRWQNLYQTSFRGVDVVYCYLLPPMLERLAPRFARELPRGARVISYGFPLPDREPTKVEGRTPGHGPLYVYVY